MKDQHLDTDDESLDYDNDGPTAAQVQRWKDLDAAAANKWLEETQQVIDEVAREMAAEAAAGLPVKLLITRDELLAAGALDVPPAWRKSLSAEGGLFSESVADDENAEKQQPAKVEPD